MPVAASRISRSATSAPHRGKVASLEVPPLLPGVEVVIPFYNEREFLPATLESLLSQSRRPDHFLLVDNASDDGCAEVARDILVRAGVEFTIERETEKGKAAALRRACGLLTRAAAVFVDADTLYPEHYVEKALSLLAAEPELSAVLALGFSDDWDAEHRARFTRERMDLARRFPRRCFTGGYGHVYRTSALLRCGGYGPHIWPHVLMDHEIVHRLLRIGPVRHDTDLWCLTSSRRSDRGRVRWNLAERLLYRNLADEAMDWFFYRFLWGNFARRGMSGLNLREQSWKRTESRAA